MILDEYLLIVQIDSACSATTATQSLTEFPITALHSKLLSPVFFKFIFIDPTKLKRNNSNLNSKTPTPTPTPDPKPQTKNSIHPINNPNKNQPT